MIFFRRYARRFLVIVGLMALTLLAVTGGASAATPVPPFSQCPAVGIDTSCAVLIVYSIFTNYEWGLVKVLRSADRYLDAITRGRGAGLL